MRAWRTFRCPARARRGGSRSARDASRVPSACTRRLSLQGRRHEGPRMTAYATCLGCGLACDDIDVIVKDGAITEARNACALGTRWFGDGRVPTRAADGAIDKAAALLRAARRPLVYLAPDMANDTYGAAAAVADVLHAL